MRNHCLSILLACILCLPYSLSNAEEIWKITSLDWQPYSGSNMSSQGNSIQKLRNLLKKKNISLVVEFYPWARAQEIAKRKGYVGYYPAWPEEVQKGFIASPPIDWSEISVLTYQGSGLEWNGLENLFQYRIGLVSTYRFPKFIEAMMQEYPGNIDRTPNEVSLLRKLSKKRFRAAITDPSVMFYLAGQEGIDNVEVLANLATHSLVLAFRNSPENMQRLEVVQQLLREEESNWKTDKRSSDMYSPQ